MRPAIWSALSIAVLITSLPAQNERPKRVAAIAGPVLAIRPCKTKDQGTLVVSAKGLARQHPRHGLELLWAPRERVVAAAFAPDAIYSFRSAEHQDCLFVLGSPEGPQQLVQLRIHCTGERPRLETIGDPIEVRGVESIACTKLAATVLLGYADGTVGVPGVEQRLALHAGPVRALAIDPLGQRFASAGRDGLIALGSLELLDAEIETAAARTLRDHSAGVECLTFHEDGTLASGALDGRVRFHDREGRLLSSLDRGPAVLSITHGPRSDLPFVWGDASGRVLAGGHGVDRSQELVTPSTDDESAPITSLSSTTATLWYAPRGALRSRVWER